MWWLANASPSKVRVAEGEGFEPPARFPVQWFSRPPPSTTRPSLRVEISPEFAHSRRLRQNSGPCVTESVPFATTRHAAGHRTLHFRGSRLRAQQAYFSFLCAS